ncbi:hypothetical protein NHQ30_009293 [Ciborinia camelliae]|nr:hypothetical protein NHQ30_009293 [Ciborinia camelliae]
MAPWQISYFTVQSNNNHLFANGFMQVAVNITIEAINPDTGDVRHLTPKELSTIQLVNYFNTDEVLLSGEWWYSAEENGFEHTMPSTKNVVPDTPHHHENLYQGKTYWVSTILLETKSIGARILQPDNTLVTTHSDDFDSFTNLEGKPPVEYSLSNVKFERRDTYSGENWDQDNYYLSSTKYAWKRANMLGKLGSNYVVEGMRHSGAYWSEGASKYIHYMWPMGSQASVKAGFTHYVNGIPFPVQMPTITIREYTDAICFTRLLLQGLLIDIYRHYGLVHWKFDTSITLYDIYGNWGDFTVSHEDKNLLSLHDRPRSFVPPSDAENKDVSDVRLF